MKTIFYLILLFLGFNICPIKAQAQIVSKDSVSINTEFTKTTLFLEFNHALSLDTVYATGLPFTFVFMAPKDSISIQSVTKNQANTAYTIEFNTRPNTYYSLLSLDVKTASDNDWHSFSKNFLAGSASGIDTAKIQFFNVVLKSNLYESVDYKPTLTTLVLKPATFRDLVSKYQNKEINQILEYPFEDGIISLSTYHFENQELHSPGSYYGIYQNLFASNKDSVMLIPFFTGRDQNQLDKISSPFPRLLIEWRNNWEYLSFSDSIDKILSFIKPIQEFNDNSFTVELLTTFIDPKISIPSRKFTLNSAYPNPFNPSTSVSFSVSEPSRISFSVFDILGRKVKELSSSESLFSSGKHQFSFDFSSLASGVYVIEASGFSLSSGVKSTQTIKVSLAK